MGQSASATTTDGVLDLVITNAMIVDHSGIYKADIGIRSGRIAGIGKAGNPDVMNGVTPGMIIGAGTEVLAGEGKIVTAGGIDAPRSFHLPTTCGDGTLWRSDNTHWWRYRSRNRNRRHYMHTGYLEYAPNARIQRMDFLSIWDFWVREIHHFPNRCASKSRRARSA